MTKITDISALSEAAQNFACIYKKKNNSKAGALEKHLIAALILLGLLSIILFVLYFVTEHYYKKLLKEKICNSNECIQSASTLFQTMDFSQDPCQDFYQFACGKFGTEHPINENSLYNSWFAEKDNYLNRMVLGVLRSPKSDSDLKIVQQMKEFYQSCANKSELNAIGIKPLYEVLEMLELPRSIPTNETVENFNLARTLALAQRHLSEDILVSLSITRKTNKIENETNSNIFKISPGILMMNIFDIWKPAIDLFNDEKHSKFHDKFKKKKKMNKPNFSSTASKQTVKATVKFISGILQKINEDMETEENLFNGFNSSHYQKIAYKIMSFTSKLHKGANHNNTESSKMQQMTLSVLQELLNGNSSNISISNRIDWEEYVSTLLENLNKTYDMDREPIVVVNVKYFEFLTRLLEKVKPEIIQRYVWWKIVEQYAKYTTSDIRAIYIRYYYAMYGETATLPRSHVCANLMKSTMTVALSHEMALSNNFSTASQKVLEMLKDIEMSFERLVNSAQWMDAKTKFLTLEKAKAVRNEIGYAKWVGDSEKVDEYYQGLHLNDSDFLMNVVRISEWEVQKALNTLGEFKKNLSENNWFINPLQVNAYYSHEENAIIIPAGILQAPFYFRGLESLNYGAIGTILGHELTHGFDIEGKNYNKFGEQQENWWPDSIISEYEKRTLCFIKQYQNYTLYENSRVNGTYTLSENIADNGGIRESFRAYQLYIARHGQEPKLPGFENFTHEQLLFLSFANIWCETANPKYYKMSHDPHSPQRVRVLASLQNMKEFSKAFKCSNKSFMNPENKCIIW